MAGGGAKSRTQQHCLGCQHRQSRRNSGWASGVSDPKFCGCSRVSFQNAHPSLRTKEETRWPGFCKSPRSMQLRVPGPCQESNTGQAPSRWTPLQDAAQRSIIMMPRLREPPSICLELVEPGGDRVGSLERGSVTSTECTRSAAPRGLKTSRHLSRSASLHFVSQHPCSGVKQDTHLEPGLLA